MINIGVLSAFLTVLAWTTYNIASKKASPYFSIYKLSLITIGLGVLPMLFAFLATGLQVPGIQQIAISAIAGIFLCVGFLFYFKAIESQQLTSVIAFGEIQPAILTIFGIFILNEVVTQIDVISILLIFGGAFLVISTEGFKINTKLIPAFLANVSWTVYWLLMSEALSGTKGFAFQVLTSRLIALALMIIVLYVTIGSRKLNFKPKSKLNIYSLVLLVAAVGLFDGLGDTIFSFTINSSLVAVGGAITALGPVLVSGLSYFIFKDRLTKAQGIGLAIMIIGAILLSIG